MAHIPDGVLSVPVLIGGGVLAAGGLALGLRRLDERDIPKTAILAAVFFVVSLVSVPVGPSSIHLLLSGLMGLVLGVRAIPAVFVGLLLQAALFGFGGLTTLGVNVVDIAFPGVVFAALARPLIDAAQPRRAVAVAGLVAALAVLGTAGCVSLALALSSAEYLPSAKIVAVTYVPLAAAEAVITALVVGFLLKVRPALLASPAGRPA
ncbi:Substrate-specific component NikM of nickel ECF transporter [Rhodovulum sp. PH10]|uniref:cobalt transporter CbiM n=1 Tax=Rhodovulum sp. PH10 TaxID=1187851 RepID=UPI00027C1EDC|nr:cobalt transporter CbiM [Rhodovulum sp. PH10]EJW09733.1 Substrate-specific component NikM of nickel ECF transporter [Rhodovulum sp. PH10]